MEQLNMQVNCDNVATSSGTTTATFSGHISGPTKEHSLNASLELTYVGSTCPFVQGNAYQLIANDAE